MVIFSGLSSDLIRLNLRGQGQFSFSLDAKLTIVSVDHVPPGVSPRLIRSTTDDQVGVVVFG